MDIVYILGLHNSFISYMVCSLHNRIHIWIYNMFMTGKVDAQNLCGILEIGLEYFLGW